MWERLRVETELLQSQALGFLRGDVWPKTARLPVRIEKRGRVPVPVFRVAQYIMRGRNSTMSGTKTQRMMTPTVTKTKGRAL